MKTDPILKIKVRIETHYGRTSTYPICETALIFSKIAGTKTLTPKVLKLIKTLGYEIEVQAPQLNLDLDTDTI